MILQNHTVLMLSMVAISGILIFSTVMQTANAEPEAPKGGHLIKGAGATFPYPLIEKWGKEYQKLYPGISIDYKSIGSGGGIKEHTGKRVDFGASDAPLSSKERSAAPNTLHIPETLGAVALVYNIPEIPQSGLKLTGSIIADIYLGKIKNWNDPQIKMINPDLQLPDETISPVRRSDGSGTTFVFTDYLSTTSEQWKQQVGKAKAVEWPTGIGAPGNDGVTEIMKKIPYAFGYVELSYAIKNQLSYAFIENGDGTQFVEPSLDSISTASSATAPSLPAADSDWSGVSIINAHGKNSYPISSFSYILLYDDLQKVTSDKTHAKATIHLIYWMITDGQKYSSSLQYVPIPPEVKEIGKQGLAKVTFNGEKLFDYQPTASDAKQSAVPSWIKNNARWWSEGTIGDEDFVQGIQYMIQKKIIKIDNVKNSDTAGSKKVPSWVKNNARWWSEGTIQEEDFLKSLTYLISNGIIRV